MVGIGAGSARDGSSNGPVAVTKTSHVGKARDGCNKGGRFRDRYLCGIGATVEVGDGHRIGTNTYRRQVGCRLPSWRPGIRIRSKSSADATVRGTIGTGVAAHVDGGRDPCRDRCRRFRQGCLRGTRTAAGICYGNGVGTGRKRGCCLSSLSGWIPGVGIRQGATNRCSCHGTGRSTRTGDIIPIVLRTADGGIDNRDNE